MGERRRTKLDEHGQLLLAVPRRPSKNGTRWGGRRERAGRKPNGPKAGEPHVTRPPQTARAPMHVSVRVLGDVPRLRQRRGYQIARRALARANRFDDARICEISIQHNHVHLIVEADSREALTRTMSCRPGNAPADAQAGTTDSRAASATAVHARTLEWRGDWLAARTVAQVRSDRVPVRAARVDDMR